MRYEIPTKSLAIVSHAMAKKDVRYYLNGLQVRDDICTATDGHMMLRAKDTKQVAPAPLLLPRDAVEWALKAAKTTATVVVERGEGRALIVRACGQSYACEEIDGQFPDCDAIIPFSGKPMSHDTVGFNGEYLVRLAKAAKAGGDRYQAVRIEMAGERAARIDFPNIADAGGVLMPLRKTLGITTVPFASRNEAQP